MVTASQAARPQWAGLVDDLFERPLLKNARAGLRNALMSTLTGDTLYRNVFFSFADAVVLWHYGHTQERTGSARLDTAYDAMRRLLAGADHFLETRPPAEPDVQYFHRLRRIRQMIRSEEHTSELQSQSNLVCRLLLEKKKKARDMIDIDRVEQPKSIGY